MNIELPRGWALAKIPDLIGRNGVFSDGDWVESEDQDLNGDVRLIQLADVGDGFYVNKSNRFLTKCKARELHCTFLSAGDVLVARMPEPLGRACIFPGDEKDAVTVVDVCIVRGEQDHIDQRWLMHFINSPELRAQIHTLQSGSTRKRISRGNLSTIPLPVPPRAEQTRIVEKLEELLSDLDAGMTELKTAQRKLAKYRQSLLKAAVEGALTADWRAAHGKPKETGAELLQRSLSERRALWEQKQHTKFAERGQAPPRAWQARYPEPVPPDPTDLGSLPQGWVWSTMDQCALDEDGITDGPFGSNLKSEHYTGSGPRVIRLQNIGDGSFHDAPAFISEDRYVRLRKHAVFEGDVVIAMLGEVLPRACAIPEGIAPAIVKADCARVRVNSELILPELVVSILNSEPTRKRVNRLVKGIGRPRVNLGSIRSIPVPLPPRSEQVQLLNMLSESLETCNQQNSAIDRVFSLLAAQRKNILKAAFSGQLVPQDANDELASELLARILADRASNSGRVPRRHRKTS